ncbi:MAG TPA: TetR/AcrR family transcriptional regulator [Mycobacteriales bacterium]|nr:TetR/AcrR family transcriptional regulator [Mycobacteriales bacterium]
MRSRGWGGSPPADDDEARARIIEAAMRCVDSRGPTKTTLSDVATELGVTRQTVYRLYSNIDELLQHVGIAAGDQFVNRMVARVSGQSDPAEMLVECLAYTIERLPKERYISLLFVLNLPVTPAGGITSPEAFALANALFDRLPVDWEAYGIVGRDRDDLVEIYLRTLQSFEADPGPSRTRAQTRALLRRWVGSAVRDVAYGSREGTG